MDAREFKETFLPMSDKLYRFAMRFSKNHEKAEDVVQEVFLKLLKMGNKLDGYRSKEALAFTVTRNLCLDKRRTGHTIFAEDTDNLEKQETADPPDVMLDRKEKVNRVFEILEKLPENQKIVLYLRDVEGYDFVHIAGVTGMTVNNVRVVLSRARKNVRETLIKQLNDGTGTGEKTFMEIL